MSLYIILTIVSKIFVVNVFDYFDIIKIPRKCENICILKALHIAFDFDVIFGFLKHLEHQWSFTEVFCVTLFSFSFFHLVMVGRGC